MGFPMEGWPGPSRGFRAPGEKVPSFLPEEGLASGSCLEKGTEVVILLVEGPFLEIWRPKLESSSCCTFSQGVKLSKTLSQGPQYHQKTPPALQGRMGQTTT